MARSGCQAVFALCLLLVFASASALPRSLLQEVVQDAGGANDQQNSNTVTPSGPAPASWAALPSNTAPSYNYAEALHKALLFYEAQRSGVLTKQRLAWRGSSCQDCVGKYGEDLSGGFYEAGGSYLKHGLPGAYAVTNLAWGVIEFPDAFEKTNELNTTLEFLYWGADYIVKSYPAPEAFLAFLGNVTADHETYFGPPEDYPLYNPPRNTSGNYAYVTPENPGSEIVGESVAALAATSMAFRDYEPTYSDSLLPIADQLYNFAVKYPGSYMTTTDPALIEATYLYNSTGYNDELAWASIWMYMATENLEDPDLVARFTPAVRANYLTNAKKYYRLASYDYSANPYNAFQYGWDTKLPALHILMYQRQPDNTAFYQSLADQLFKVYLPDCQSTYSQEGLPIPCLSYTKKGLVWASGYGSLRYAANIAFLAQVHSKYLLAADANDAFGIKLFNFAKSQIDYILGDGGRSYVVGFGTNSPVKPFHKASFNAYIDWPLREQPWYVQVKDIKYDNPSPMRFIVYGAMMGGPISGNDDYNDVREDYQHTEPVTEYNSALANALAGLINYYLPVMNPYSDCNLDLGWSNPNATQALAAQFFATCKDNGTQVASFAAVAN